MNRINDGGPAFPRPASEDRRNGTLPDGDDAIPEQEGMTLRDYFAAKALPEMIGCTPHGNECVWTLTVAKRSYEIADAMLEVRKQ